jgi:hypothetical protein
MSYLHASLQAWNTPAFAETLAREIAQLGLDELPLQAGLSRGSMALDDNLTAIIISAYEEAGRICARVGISYSGIIAGCSCADDPTPDNLTTEYCQIRLEIDKATAAVKTSLLPEQGG